MTDCAIEINYTLLEMQKKTVVAVEDLMQTGNRKKNGGGNRRRESAPHYSRKYDSGLSIAFLVFPSLCSFSFSDV